MQTDGFSEPDLEIHQNVSLKDKLLKKGFWLYVLSFIVAPTGYIIKMLISRTISVEEVGLIYSIIGFISILATYNDLGLTDSLQYFLPTYLIDKNYSKAKSLLIFTWVSQFITGILIGGLLILGAPWLATHYFKSPDATILLRIFALYFLIINLFQVIQSIFFATQSVKIASGIDAIRLRSVTLFVIGYWYFDLLTVYNFAWAQVLGLIGGVIGGIFFSYKELGWLNNQSCFFNKIEIKERLRYGMWVLIGSNAATLFGQIDQQFALLYMGKDSAGYRSNYMSMTAIMSMATTPLMSYFLPLFVELTKKGAYNKFKKLFAFAYCRFGAIGILIGLIAYFYGIDIAVILFGNKFRISGELYKFSSIFMCVGLFVSINFQYLVSIGLLRLRVKLIIIATISTFISDIILVKYLGLKGLILGNTIGQTIMLLATSRIIYQKSSYKLGLK